VLIGTVVGVGETIKRLDAMPRKVRDEVAKEVNEQTQAVLKLAKENVNGPRPSHLGVKTGTLRRSINARMFNEAHRIYGTVGIKLTYAAAHEFGIRNLLVSVKAHTRRNMRQMKEDERSRINKGKRITHDTRKQLGQGVIQVRQHQRMMQMPERSFLRRALDERRDEIEAGIRAAVERGTKA